MNHNHFNRQNNFTDVWAILRQPSSGWVTRQLLPNLKGSEAVREGKGQKLEKAGGLIAK